MDDDLRRRLQRVVENVPEGSPDFAGVEAGGRRRKMRQRALVALSTAACVAIAAVGAAVLLGRDDRIPPPPRDVAGPVQTEGAEGGVVVDHPDGWRIEIHLEDPAGPIQLRVENPRVSDNAKTSSVTHELVFVNTTDEVVRFEDTRRSDFVGGAEPPVLLVADEGCGYARLDPGAPPEAGVCQEYLDAMTLEPGATDTREITLSWGINGFGPLEAGTYVFERTIAFRVGDGPPRRFAAEVTYTISDATSTNETPRDTSTPDATDNARPPGEAFALWPQDTLSAAEAACKQMEADGSGWRSDQERFAAEFARRVLGWSDAYVELLPQDAAYVRKTEDTPERGIHDRVWLSMKDLYPPDEGGAAPSCWSVISVSRPPDDRPTGVGIGVQGRDFSIGFDPLGAAAARGRIAYGDMSSELRWTGGDTVLKGQLDARPATTGHFLLLFLDESGDVFSATGGPLPAGDFAAG